MSIYTNDINNSLYNTQNIRFAAQKNVSYTGNPIDTIADKIEEEKEKKHNKAALKAGAIVAGVVAMVAILNPRYSKNFADKMHKVQSALTEKVQSTKNNKFLNKIYTFGKKTMEGVLNTINFITNINPFKDIYVKNFCNNEFKFNKVKNLQTRKKLQKIDQKRVAITSKIHNGITNCFDKIGQFTVKRSYKTSSKDFNKLDDFIKQNLDKLSSEDKKIIENKLAEITTIRSYYNEQDIVQRLHSQEGLMKNLERDFMNKLHEYGAGYRNKWVKNGEHMIQNLYYWPEEIMRPAKEQVEKNGLDVVEKLIGNGSGKKGAYNEIIELLSKKLEAGDKKTLNKLYNKADKALRKANTNECIEYFGKKRDLVMGSAPTDVMTAVGSLGIAGIALAKADDKKQRTSKLVTGVIPVVAGVGVSIGMTSMLVSGGKGFMLGLLSTFVLNRLGILVDKHLLGNKEYYEEKSHKKENVVYA